MNKSLNAQISGLFLLALCMAPISMAHDSCLFCHTEASPVVGNAGLISGLSRLCINCHADRVGAGEHVIDVEPITAMAAPLPLLNGRLTCITCHDPHSSLPTLLRSEQTLLCPTCHHK